MAKKRKTAKLEDYYPRKDEAVSLKNRDYKYPDGVVIRQSVRFGNNQIMTLIEVVKTGGYEFDRLRMIDRG